MLLLARHLKCRRDCRKVREKLGENIANILSEHLALGKVRGPGVGRRQRLEHLVVRVEPGEERAVGRRDLVAEEELALGGLELRLDRLEAPRVLLAEEAVRHVAHAHGVNVADNVAAELAHHHRDHAGDGGRLAEHRRHDRADDLGVVDEQRAVVVPAQMVLSEPADELDVRLLDVVEVGVDVDLVLLRQVVDDHGGLGHDVAVVRDEGERAAGRDRVGHEADDVRDLGGAEEGLDLDARAARAEGAGHAAHVVQVDDVLLVVGDERAERGLAALCTHGAEDLGDGREKGNATGDLHETGVTTEAAVMGHFSFLKS
eukprot:PhM_4_TR11441/c0_g1_i1/m.73197